MGATTRYPLILDFTKPVKLSYDIERECQFLKDLF